ncbi:hypothetical protein [Faecalispora jeddahensis]|nr:hypothetical protein [Faecalispora jeddahensis]
MILKESILCKFEEVMEKKTAALIVISKPPSRMESGTKNIIFLQYRQ